MQFLLACYDSGHRSASGAFCPWRHEDIPESVFLDAVYACTLGVGNKSDWLGGVVGINEDWLCWYRQILGTRDRRGRAGRIILAFAFTPRPTAGGRDGSPILESGYLAHSIDEIASGGSPNRPEKLEIELPMPPVTANDDQLEQILHRRRKSFVGPGAIAHAAALCAHLPPSERFHCAITGELKAEEAIIELLTTYPEKQAKTSNVQGLSRSISTNVPRVPSAVRPNVDRHRFRISRQTLVAALTLITSVAVIVWISGTNFVPWRTNARALEKNAAQKIPSVPFDVFVPATEFENTTGREEQANLQDSKSRQLTPASPRERPIENLEQRMEETHSAVESALSPLVAQMTASRFAIGFALGLAVGLVTGLLFSRWKKGDK